MRRCLQLARCGEFYAKPNPMVGAVIVADGRIIGEGYHVRCGEGHAEVNAFASVSPADEHLLPEATIYVSLEPCSHWGKTPPCADLIVKKGVRRAVVGCIDPFAEVQGRGIKRLRDAGIEVTVGVLEDECKRLNKRFFTSTPTTLMLMHKLRAENDAIVVGKTTEEREHPQLTVRHWVGPSPVKMVLSHATEPLPGIEGQLSDDEVLRVLMKAAHDSSIQSMMVEGGRHTLQSFIDNHLYDEIHVEQSPQIVASGTPAPQLPTDIEVVRQQTITGNNITLYRRI